LYIKLVDSWASTIKRTSAVPHCTGCTWNINWVVSSIKIFTFAFSMSYVYIVCLFKFSPKKRFAELSKWYFRRISCGKNDGKLLSNWWPPSWIRLGYKAKSKKVSPKYYSALGTRLSSGGIWVLRCPPGTRDNFYFQRSLIIGNNFMVKIHGHTILELRISRKLCTDNFIL
jgi:hypothetical protein